MKKSNLFVNLLLGFFLLFFVSSFSPTKVYGQAISESDSYKIIREFFSLLFVFKALPAPSSTAPQIPSVSPYPTTPYTSQNSDKSQKIENLVAQVNINCQNGTVSKDNESCLNKIVLENKPLDQSIIYQLKPSTNACGSSCFYLQCVRFVKAAVLLVGDKFDTYGNAIEYVQQNKWPTGYHYVKKGTGAIQAGDLPIWDVGSNGHIAYATRVLGANYFMVAEANFDRPGGHVRLYPKSVDDPTLIGWLTQK